MALIGWTYFQNKISFWLVSEISKKDNSRLFLKITLKPSQWIILISMESGTSWNKQSNILILKVILHFTFLLMLIHWIHISSIRQELYSDMVWHQEKHAISFAELPIKESSSVWIWLKLIYRLTLKVPREENIVKKKITEM